MSTCWVRDSPFAVITEKKKHKRENKILHATDRKQKKMAAEGAFCRVSTSIFLWFLSFGYDCYRETKVQPSLALRISHGNISKYTEKKIETDFWRIKLFAYVNDNLPVICGFRRCYFFSHREYITGISVWRKVARKKKSLLQMA